MQRSSGRRLQDVLLASASVGFVLTALTLVDERVRGLLVRVTSGDIQVAAAIPDIHLHTLMRTATDLIGRDHATIAGFVVAGGVLFLMMFKL